MNILSHFTTPKFQEEYSAKIPALTLLCNLGWTYLSPEQAMTARSGKKNNVLLRDVLKQELQKRRFTFEGKEHSLSEKSIDYLINQLASPALNEGLTLANEKIYNHLMYGISVNEFIDGKKANPTIQFIDWHNINNNSFLFTEEFAVLRSNGFDQYIPDIVCFVNGIPLAIIEAKRPVNRSQKEPTIEEGISHHIRNQYLDGILQLYAYSQILLSINGIEGRYGTQGAKKEFWTVWEEEDIPETEFYRLKNQKISAIEKEIIFQKRPQVLSWYENLTADKALAVTGQDRILISLLSPQRLLEMIRYYIFFDKKYGKIIARYPQVFGIKRLIERLNTKHNNKNREGGVIWHTTGSGKSFTMVFLSKALLWHETLRQCRLVIITDRIDLEAQISKTFISTGELAAKKDKENAMATSGRNLATRIGQGNERFIFSLIQKFNSAAKLPECYNDSSDIIVLVDEGHRSHGGENHARMRQMLPNAAFIAFTGTPLLKEDKTTSKFGPILHAYTMQKATVDKTVAPLLYEERVPELEINERGIDNWFARITEDLTEAQKADLKRKYAKKGQIYQAEDRIRLIAWDIAQHFRKNIMSLGLKGQIACASKSAAILYKKFLDEKGFFESAVIMSAPDTREGNSDMDEAAMPAITRWWKENVGTKDEPTYTKDMIERFDKDDNLKMLIVIDKLLTGFDEPKNTVLYIDKPLRQHNLIQAIARVNRIHESKKFGFLIDYRGILHELDTTIAKYQDLASRTQGGFDIDDLKGLYHQVSTEYKRLPQLYASLLAIFKDVKNRDDIEQLRQVLIPKMQEINGELIDINQKIRDDFYEAFAAFNNCFQIALQSVTYFEDKSFTAEDHENYKIATQAFADLRQYAKQDAEQTISYVKYQTRIEQLLDKEVSGLQIREPRGVYAVSKMGIGNPETWSKEKTRNETDIIKTRVTRIIEQDLRNDPYAQEAFSKLLRQVIKEAEELFNHPLKQYMLFFSFEEKVKNKQLDELPNSFKGNPKAQAYFGIFKKVLSTAFAHISDQEKWVALAFKIDEIVKIAKIENSINPQNVEASIRKQLLPLILQNCKTIGAGMDQTTVIVELIVQTTRTDLSIA